MALVAYDNSDSSEYEDDESTPKQIVHDSIDSKEATIPLVADESSKQQEDESLFNHLPQPIAIRKVLVEEDDEFLHKKASVKTEPKQKPKIMVPLLSDFKDVEGTVPNAKPKAIGGKKSGLLSLLPQPRNGVLNITKPLIPHVLTHKPHTSTVKKKTPLPSTLSRPENVKTTTESNSLVTEYSDESDTEGVENDFFSINKPLDLPTEDLPLDVDPDFKEKIMNPNTKKEPRSIESYFKKDDEFISLSTTDSIEDSTQYPATSENLNNDLPGSSSDVVIDEEAIMKLCGSRGKRKREEIQIVDINQQEVLNEAREWLLKGLMDDTSKRQSASKKRGNEPTSQQRRKHQITYLAHQAKANEAELQNQWANSRMTKRKTQSKYGF